MNVVLPVASVQCDSVHIRNKVILLTSEQVLKINIGEHFEDDTAWEQHTSVAPPVRKELNSPDEVNITRCSDPRSIL